MKKTFFITMFVLLFVNMFLFLANAQDWVLDSEVFSPIVHANGQGLAFAKERLYYLQKKGFGPIYLMAWDTNLHGSSPYQVTEVPSTAHLIDIPDDNPNVVAVASHNRVDLYWTGKGVRGISSRLNNGDGRWTITFTTGKDIIDAIAFDEGGSYFIAAKSHNRNTGDAAILRGWNLNFGRRDVDLNFSAYTVDALAMTWKGPYPFFFIDWGEKVYEYRWRRWTTSTNAWRKHSYTHRNSGVRALAYEAQYIASGHKNGDVEIWNFEPKGHVRTLRGASHEIHSLAFTRERRYLAAASNDWDAATTSDGDGVFVWHVSSGKLVDVIRKGSGVTPSFFDVAFSPNGTLAIRDQHSIFIYKRKQGESALDISKRKLDSATLIDGLKIQKNRMLDVKGLTDLSFWYNGDNEFLLLRQGAFNTCGTASVEMLLHYYGKKATQSDIWKAGGIHTVYPGTWPDEAEQALDKLGVPSEWYNRGTLDHLKSYVRQNRPPMILLRFQAGMHYVVVVGYNRGNDFLVADPNGFFRWISSTDLLKGWSLKEPGLPSEYGVNNVEDWFLSQVDLVIGENNYIVPDSPPQYHFRPNWSELQYAHVVGPSEVNWGWAGTKKWERPLEFLADFHHYVGSYVEPSSLQNPGGIHVSRVDGHRRNGRSVTFWGKITHGKAQRGELYLFVRSYRHPRSNVAAAPSVNLTVNSIESLPAQSELFSNYPNPFNPETWIPYQLAVPAEVKVDIYAADGQLVRTLSLGHQGAGVYRSRSRAAYWDGRNDVGEYVASGVYFYTLTAGDFQATRKMLIVK
ncbi:MAG: C39 family peptidase [Candidatus Poribacteria bacterium]|nr:C39 family peptidase [Candidatus Poribacteria bacterium]